MKSNLLAYLHYKSQNRTNSVMATHTSVITTGVVTDKRSFKWKVENFDLVRQSPTLIAAQKFQFSAGESIGLPTSWSCYLHHNPWDKSIGIFFQLLKRPVDVDEVNISYGITIKGTGDNDNDFYHDKEPLQNIVKYGWGFSKLVPENAKLEELELPLVDGSLVIDIDFNLYAIKKHPVTPDLGGKLETFKIKSLEQLSKDQREIEKLASSDANYATKIFSKDGIEFPVNRGILSARSPVFKMMFDTKMSEAETGEVRIDDLSGKTLTVLLDYIYAGSLHEDWKSDDVIEELTYAAHKYELGLLTQFLDDVLGSVCNKENAKRLLVLVKKLEMKKAEMELFAYVKNNAVSVEDITVIVE